MLNKRQKRPAPAMGSEINRHKNPLKHARDQAQSSKVSSDHGGIIRIETCGICLEHTNILQMFSVHDCLHKCCLYCVKKHVEVNLRQATLPTCPHEGCKSSIKIKSCGKILSPELVELLNQRLKESQIPVPERIYCPYPQCSTLMSKGQVLKYSQKCTSMNAEQSGYRKCLKCRLGFCVNCKVPWHSEMNCCEYKKLHPYSCVEEEMLNSLVKMNSWKQCVKCRHMIELVTGCFHIICRCGYQFCYKCGLGWKDKKACQCPLWDERNILNDRIDYP